jgi:phosphatidylserine/phosphatidylglycerophosphate/cardiolipin synthase-like enzyme
VIDTLVEVPSHLRERLACALESGLLQELPPAAALRSVLGSSEEMEPIASALAEFNRLGVGGAAAATWLRSLSKLHARAPRTDLVWSGPDVPGLHARDTRRVYEELLGSAIRSLWVSTYAFFDGPRVFEVLARRMEKTTGLQVTVLLNIQRKRGDTTVAEQLVRQFTDRFWSVEWPGAARPRVFYDPRALEPDVPGGVLHAKAVVSDDDTVFVTSANLTEAALGRNIELGLLVRDRALARSIVAHFRGLIDRRLLRALPNE